MTEPDYVNATNKAYETLIKFKKFSFPVSIFSILKAMKNVAIHTYSEAAKRFNMTFNEYYVLASSEYGYSVRDFKNNRYEIFYNEQKSETTIRFTLAHELGHIILEHKEDGYKQNKEANCFARNCLCPIPAVIEMGLETSNDYVNCFYISEPMAEIAVSFQRCDYNNIASYNYNTYNDNVFCYMTGMSLNEIYGYPC